MSKCFLLTLASIALSTSTFAGQSKYGSQCGLADGYDRQSFMVVGVSTKISFSTKLTSLQANQVFLATKELEGGQDVGETPANPMVILSDRTDDSDSSEVYIEDQLVHGQSVTVVTNWRRGNLSGVIFKKGTTDIIAKINGSSVVCR